MNTALARWTRTVALIVAACVIPATVACVSPASAPAPQPDATVQLSGTLTVYAAASLTDVFNDVASAFHAANPGARVTFNFAGSPTLVTQLDQGGEADVLATADVPNMQSALEKGEVVDAGQTFARNRLAIIVPKSNPAAIASPADLARPGIKLVLAQQGVPAGDYARRSLGAFNGKESYPASFSRTVLANLVSEEPNVKAVVAKVQLGEADAGIVYVTDVTPGVAGDVTLIPIPDAYNVVATYPIAITRSPKAPELARAFIDFVLSGSGQSILAQYGFLRAR